jgi:hypothetical protein
MNNPNTSNLILSQIENGVHRETFVSNIQQLCEKYHINFYDLLIQNKKIRIRSIREELSHDISQPLAHAITFWHIKEQRENFKNIIESNIPRNI